MNRGVGGSPAEPSETGVSWSNGLIVLRDGRLFGPGLESLVERFLGRVFRVEGVTSVTVDRGHRTATIRHEAVAGGTAGLLRRLVAIMRGDDPGATLAPSFVRGEVRGDLTEYLRGPILPACVVLFDGPGRLRLRIGLLRGKPGLAQRVERLLETVPGVRSVSAGPWIGRLLVQYDPSRLPRGRLLVAIGEAFHGPDVWSRSLPEPVPLGFTAVNATLGVAVAGHFLMPALQPLSAVLLVATNLGTFRIALRELRSGRFGLPVLYTAIVATTVASGQFITSALMTWFFRYWHRRHRRELATERHRLLHACLPLPGLVRLHGAGETDVLVEAEQIRPGDRLIVAVDEAIPADGRVVGGEGVVDEQSLCGTDGATRKRAGDSVLAGSVVLSGELIVEVEHGVAQTRAAAIGRALVAATSPTPGNSAPTRHAEAFASRAVGPTLATAGFGFLVGDLASVGAILRPDYATGPALGVPLAVLRNVALCARSGVIVNDPTVFARLAEIDLVVIDDHPALKRAGLELAGVVGPANVAEILRYAASAYRHLDDERSPALRAACLEGSIHLLNLRPTDLRGGVTIQHGARRVKVSPSSQGRGVEGPLTVEVNGSPIGVVSFRRGARLEAAEVVRRLRGAGPIQVALVTERPASEAARLAADLGVNQLRGGLSLEGKAEFLRDCRVRGLKAAFVGDCRHNARAAAAAAVTIDLAGNGAPHREATEADVQVFGDRLDRLVTLWDAGRSHTERVRSDNAWVVAPNLFCVAGAFLFGFSGLTVVALSNLGTYNVYSRAAGDLKTLGAGDHRPSQRTRHPASPA